MSPGGVFFGMTLTVSSFQMAGHRHWANDALYIFLSGIDNFAAHWGKSSGHMSPASMPLGFRQDLRRFSICFLSILKPGSGRVDFGSPSFSGTYLFEIAVKKSAVFSAVVSAVSPGNKSTGEKGLGASASFSLDTAL